MAALLFPNGSIISEGTIVALNIWEHPNESDTDTVFTILALNTNGDAYEVLSLEGALNIGAIEAKRDAIAAYLWGTVTDIDSIS
jgi:hypothetical protein